MANTDDLVTVQKNGVLAVNALTEALANFRTFYEQVQGTQTYLGLSNDSLLSKSSGRLATILVTTAGSAAGTIHDASTVGSAGAANIIGVIPMSAGLVYVGFPFTNGLVVKPGTGQVLSLCYSEDT
jgi:hypothetical protein